MKESERLQEECLRLSRHIYSKDQSPEAVEKITILWEGYSRKIEQAKIIEQIYEALRLAAGLTSLEAKIKKAEFAEAV